MAKTESKDKETELPSQAEKHRRERKEAEREQLLETLAQLGGKLTAEEDVVFQGTKIVLPADSNLDTNIRFLQQKMAEDERTMMFDRTFRYRPWDGAWATLCALKRAFGMVTQKETMGFFGPNPPRQITINVDLDETVQIPWGRMDIPTLPGAAFYLDSVNDDEFGPLFHIMVESPRKYRFQIEGIFRLVEEELKNNSIYRGKAFDGAPMPTFLDLRGVDPNKVIYSQEVHTQLSANVWSLIQYPDKCRELGIPLKRAVLLEGHYGTGKTLSANMTAKVARANGWTFIYCRPDQSLTQVLATARLYQPSIVFFEDVDRVTDIDSTEQDKVSGLLDAFDGIQAKGTEIIAVLTTNHVEKIHKGMVRPGRLDAVIHFDALDLQGVERLAKSVLPGDLLNPNVDWDLVYKAMDGFMPAFAREALDRALRYNLARNEGHVTRLDTADLVSAAEGLRPQLELMEGAKDTKERESLTTAFERIVDNRVSDQINNTKVMEGNEEYYSLRSNHS